MKKLLKLGSVLMISLLTVLMICGCAQKNDDSQIKVTENPQVRYNNLVNGGRAAYGTDGKFYYAASDIGGSEARFVWPEKDSIKVYDPQTSQNTTLLSVEGNCTFSKLMFQDDTLYAVKYDRDNKKSSLIKIDLSNGKEEVVFASDGYIYGDNIYSLSEETISKTKLGSINGQSEKVLENVDRFYGIYDGILIYNNSNDVICGYKLDSQTTVEYGKSLADGRCCPCIYNDQIYFLDGNIGDLSGGDGSYSVHDSVLNTFALLTGEKKTVLQNFNGRGPNMTISAEGKLYCDGSSSDGKDLFDLSVSNPQGQTWPVTDIKGLQGHQMGFYDLGDWIGIYRGTNRTENIDIDFCLINKSNGTVISGL